MCVSAQAALVCETRRGGPAYHVSVLALVKGCPAIHQSMDMLCHFRLSRCNIAAEV